MRRILFDMLEINIAVTIVLFLVCIFADKLRKKYGAKWLKLVWILLAVRLIIPYNFSLPFTEIRLFNVAGFEQETAYADSSAAAAEPLPTEVSPKNLLPSSGTSAVEGQETSKQSVARIQEVGSFAYTDILLGIWLVGIAGFVTYYIGVYVAFHKKCIYSMQKLENGRFLEQINSLQQEYLGKVRLEVYQSPMVDSPMLVGIKETGLVLPEGIKEWQSTALEMVVLHELCHYRQKDLWLKMLVLAAHCINWFNPVLLLLKRQCFYDMELVCDRNALEDCSMAERELYARTMLSFAGKKSQTAAFAANFSVRKKDFKKRIDSMFDVSEKKKGAEAFLFVFTLLLGLGLLVSCGYKPEELTTTEREAVMEAAGAQENSEQRSGGVSTHGQETTDKGDTAESVNGAGEDTESDAQKIQDTEEDPADLPVTAAAPTKEEVLAMRSLVLTGMTEAEIERLTENIKVANSAMERAYFYEDLFGKLADPEHLYWNYIDQKGEIQIGWEADGSPVIAYNRFDADNFIALMEEMRDSLQSNLLKQDFDNLIENMALAKETHEAECVEQIYRILHDMDYFLLRYGIEDVGKYMKDLSTVGKYYGVLEVYKDESLR